MTIESFITGHEPAIRLGALLGILGVIARGYTSNFGFNVPWWDRLMGTYRAQPEFGHDGMTIGHPAP